jgi:chloramphenicol-sensitive protein RarD
MSNPAAFLKANSGLAYALASFLMWGLFPLYFHVLAGVPSAEVLAHRVMGSAVLLVAWAAYSGGLGKILGELRNPRRLAFYTVTTILISANWWIFIWAVQIGRTLEASLGYYINPLVNVLLGVIFLAERPSRRQWLAIAIAAGGVVWLIATQGVIPWVSLALALTFGSYALIRKMAGFDAMLGLTVETVLLAPIAVVALVWWGFNGQLVFAHQGLTTDLLLLAAGLITVLPLICFLEAGLRLKMATLGIVQYITPSMQFILAIFVFHEHFDSARSITFVCIWLALAIYTADALRQHRMRPIAAAAE